MKRVLVALAISLGLGPLACQSEPSESSPLDTRLETHAVLPGRPSADGLAYLEHTVVAHREADATTDALARAEGLIRVARIPSPADDGIAEIARLELFARAGESLLSAEADDQARALLEPILATERSLPIDRASARCLVALGDAAAGTGDHGLAMGSYARALEMLSLLLEEVDS